MEKGKIEQMELHMSLEMQKHFVRQKQQQKRMAEYQKYLEEEKIFWNEVQKLRNECCINEDE